MKDQLVQHRPQLLGSLGSMSYGRQCGTVEELERGHRNNNMYSTRNGCVPQRSKSHDGSIGVYDREDDTLNSASNHSASSLSSSPGSSSSPGYVVASDAAYIDYVLSADGIDMSKFTIHSFQRKRRITNSCAAVADESMSCVEITYYHSIQYRKEIVWILETSCKVYNECYYQGETSACSISNQNGMARIRICQKSGGGAATIGSNCYNRSSSRSLLKYAPKSRSLSPFRPPSIRSSPSMSQPQQPPPPPPPPTTFSSPLSMTSPASGHQHHYDSSIDIGSPRSSLRGRYTEDLMDILRRSAEQYQNQVFCGAC